jgi:hypothetical protein
LIRHIDLLNTSGSILLHHCTFCRGVVLCGSPYTEVHRILFGRFLSRYVRDETFRRGLPDYRSKYIYAGRAGVSFHLALLTSAL